MFIHDRVLLAILERAVHQLLRRHIDLIKTYDLCEHRCKLSFADGVRALRWRIMHLCRFVS